MQTHNDLIKPFMTYRPLTRWLPIVGTVIYLSLGATFVNASYNDHTNNRYTDYAQVTQVNPIYETISLREPYQKCHMEERVVHRQTTRHQNRQSVTPHILGSLIGGAIGNKLGHNKSNKRVGAVAGAILGGSIAGDISYKNRQHNNRHQPNHSYTTKERVCHTNHTTRQEQQLNGYDVSYRYKGKRYNTVMANHPGKRIRVAVDVSPIDE